MGHHQFPELILSDLSVAKLISHALHLELTTGVDLPCGFTDALQVLDLFVCEVEFLTEHQHAIGTSHAHSHAALTLHTLLTLHPALALHTLLTLHPALALHALLAVPTLLALHSPLPLHTPRADLTL